MDGELGKDYWDCGPFGRLILAPMEGVGDLAFRRAMAAIGGHDECVTEFIRIPRWENFGEEIGEAKRVRILQRMADQSYHKDQTLPILHTPQIMGSCPRAMGVVAARMAVLGAKRVDINCGCPSNTVTGHGAGSSLLKDPRALHDLVVGIKAVIRDFGVSVPITVKMRSGLLDTSLFAENLQALEAAGVAFLTIHPRTKVDGYTGHSNWALLALAKASLKIPVIGSGDVLTVADALQMKRETGVDGIMIGRGAIKNPFIFRQLVDDFRPTLKNVSGFIQSFYQHIGEQALLKDKTENFKICKLKQIVSYVFEGEDWQLREHKKALLKVMPPTPDHYHQEIQSFFVTAP
jgi:tRNA-dihydrouridine synthase C